MISKEQMLEVSYYTKHVMQDYIGNTLIRALVMLSVSLIISHLDCDLLFSPSLPVHAVSPRSVCVCVCVHYTFPSLCYLRTASKSATSAPSNYCRIKQTHSARHTRTKDLSLA